MRMIGQLEGEAKARTFSDFLYVQGIENQIEADAGNSWSIWIHADEEVPRSKEWLQQFIAQPADPQFQKTALAAKDLRDQKKQDLAGYENRIKERRQLFRPLTSYSFGPVTLILILMSVIVMVMSSTQDADHDDRVMATLSISQTDFANYPHEGFFHAIQRRLQFTADVLPEIRHGEVWRLITPIFLHFSILHIFFNMLWMKDLGSMIEGRQSSLVLFSMVLVTGVVSNVAQYLVSGSSFGGMSGVVYGLFGYIWVRGKLDPASGLFMDPGTVRLMLIWFAVCFTNWLGPVANTCHAGGLLVGMLWGYLASLRKGPIRLP